MEYEELVELCNEVMEGGTIHISHDNPKDLSEIIQQLHAEHGEVRLVLETIETGVYVRLAEDEE
jgi:hypothetical protein